MINDVWTRQFTTNKEIPYHKKQQQHHSLRYLCSKQTHQRIRITLWQTAIYKNPTWLQLTVFTDRLTIIAKSNNDNSKIANATAIAVLHCCQKNVLIFNESSLKGNQSQSQPLVLEFWFITIIIIPSCYQGYFNPCNLYSCQYLKIHAVRC